MNKLKLTPVALICSLVAISACSSSDDDDDTSTGTGGSGLSTSGTTQYAYAFTRADDFSSGQIERINITDGFVVDGTYPGTTSDHALAANDEAVFQIGRFEIDNLTRFSASDTSIIDYQLSVLGEQTTTSNPQTMAIFDDDLAYLTRRSSDTMLVLDPSPNPATATELITGEISLEAYNRTSTDSETGVETIDLPDMTDAVIVDDRLFVLLENLDGFAPSNQALLAVFSTITDTEIDTESGLFPLLGIELETVNPTGLQFNEDTGELYVIGRGNFFESADVDGDPYTGGVESINPQTFQINFLVDDGDADDNNGFFVNGLVIDNTLGYLITLDGFNPDFSSINNLRTFNPSTGEVSEPVAGIEQESLTTLALGPDNHVWVGVQDDVPGFIRVDIKTGIPAEEQVVTTLVPADIVFLEIEN